MGFGLPAAMGVQMAFPGCDFFLVIHGDAVLD